MRSGKRLEEAGALTRREQPVAGGPQAAPGRRGTTMRLGLSSGGPHGAWGRAELELLLDNLPDGIILLDDAGRIVSANLAAERMLGEPLPIYADASAWLRRFGIATADGQPMLPEHLPHARAARGETVHRAALSIGRADGRPAYLAVSAYPAVGGDGGVVLIVDDISDQVRRDREAAAFQVLSQQLAAAEQDVASVYQIIVSRIAEITGADIVRLLLFDATTRSLRRVAVEMSRDLAPGADVIVPLDGASLDALAARTRLPVVQPALDLGHSATARSSIAVPLVVRDLLLGTLSYDLPTAHTFDDAEVAYLGIIATQSAVAIHNATLFQQRTSERAFLADIIEHLPAGLVVFEIVPRTRRGARQDYRVTMLNAQATTFLPAPLLRRARERDSDIIGLRIRRLATDEQSRRIVAWLDGAVAHDEIVLGEEVSFDERDAAASGAAPTYWNGAVVPLHDRAGQVSELVLLATNITEQVLTRRRIEELVRVAGTRAAELEATVSAMTEAVTVCDAGGRIRLANRAALDTFGVDTIAELLRISTLDERIHLRHTSGEPVEAAERPLARALRGEAVQADYTLFHHALGHDVHRRTSAAPVRDGTGEIIGAVAVETDITGLIELDQLKDEFISMAAHELRTPLTALRGYVQILSRHVVGSDPLSARAIETLHEQGERMERLINDLLDVGRIETHQLELRRRELDLVALVRQLAAEVGRSSSRHPIVVTSSRDQIIGSWDGDRLSQVFANLLTNAIKYSPEGGPINVTITVPDTEGEVLVAVTDRGIGIEPAELPRLFTRYGRVGRDNPLRQVGLGIGLFISKEIVDAHGGSIRVSSEPDRGSTFTVALPLREQGTGTREQ
jgi:PAS domain S-box-containing protein